MNRHSVVLQCDFRREGPASSGTGKAAAAWPPSGMSPAKRTGVSEGKAPRGARPIRSVFDAAFPLSRNRCLALQCQRNTRTAVLARACSLASVPRTGRWRATVHGHANTPTWSSPPPQGRRPRAPQRAQGRRPTHTACARLWVGTGRREGGSRDGSKEDGWGPSLGSSTRAACAAPHASARCPAAAGAAPTRLGRGR